MCIVFGSVFKLPDFIVRKVVCNYLNFCYLQVYQQFLPATHSVTIQMNLHCNPIKFAYPVLLKDPSPWPIWRHCIRWRVCNSHLSIRTTTMLVVYY
jgi:hypothetical protein